MNTRRVADKHEKRVAKALGARQTVASGQVPFAVGDVADNLFLYECKTRMTPSKSYTVQKATLDKLEQERRQALKPAAALVFTFGGDDDYYIVDQRVFKQLLDAYRREND